MIRCGRDRRMSSFAPRKNTLSRSERRRSQGGCMPFPLARREVLQTTAVGSLALAAAARSNAGLLRDKHDGWVRGEMSGAQALVETLICEGASCVFGIPGAQANELWDCLKTKGVAYVLVTHEHSASMMADGYARSTGKPGVICIVPGPGVTNALTGIGEAFLDSIPMVCIVCDVAAGEKARPFQVHELPNADLLKPVTKQVFAVSEPAEIPATVRQAFALAASGEPGPVAVLVPYNVFTALHHFRCGPCEPVGVTLDADATQRAIAMLANRKWRVGIYAGLGCMPYAPMVEQ